MAVSKGNTCERQDGGYAWFIVLGSFISHFCVLGTARSLGILYIELLDKFNETAVKTAAISAVFNTLRMFLAPLVGIFCKRFSCRLSMFLGGIIFCSGFVISGFVTSLWYLTFTYGVIAGIGASMVFTPPYIILNQYFDKRKGIANSLGTLGAGAGSVAYPPLIVFLMMKYAYFGGMILLGAMQLHNCIAGALFRPFRTAKPNQTAEIVEQENVEPPEKYPILVHVKKLDEFSSKLSLSHSDSFESIVHADEMHKSHKKVTGKNSKGVERLHSQCTELGYEIKDSADSTEASIAMAQPTKDQTDHLSKDVPTSLVKDKSASQETQPSSLVERFKSTLKKKVLIFKDTTMILYLLTVAVMPLSHGMVMWFAADSARLNGVSDTNAALLLSYFGIADVVGRVAWGPMFDTPFIRPRRQLVHALLGVIIGTTVVSHGFVTSYLAIAILICIFGVFEGGYHAQRMAVTSEIVDKSLLEESVGITIFFQGVGNLIGPLIAGYSRDTFGNYRLGYFVGGSSQTLLCILFLVNYAVKNKKK